jgi:alpha-2-macroglobulin
LTGETLDSRSAVKLGETFAVELTLTNKHADRVQNLALVDRLPAGWEVENPRLGRGGALSWVGEAWKTDALNLRDDRVELFGAVERGQTVTFVYTVRAVTAGTFTQPPVEAEAMYDPRVWAREDGQVVKVAGPWDDFLL